MRWIDTHCHLDTEAFNNDRADVLSRAKECGVDTLIISAAARTAADLRRTQAAADPAANIFASCGVHPHQAQYLDPPLQDELARVSQLPGIVAIGESGLDYHYDHSSRLDQKRAFTAQLELACERKLPIICHIRDAHKDAAEILSGTTRPGGVIHCFTGGPSEARTYLDLGFYLSFSGILTFGKNAQPIRDAASFAPLDRILLETDAPFLAPVPMRGKRNEPAFMVHTAAVLAKLRGLPERDLAEATSSNAIELFNLPMSLWPQRSSAHVLA